MFVGGTHLEYAPIHQLHRQMERRLNFFHIFVNSTKKKRSTIDDELKNPQYGLCICMHICFSLCDNQQNFHTNFFSHLSYACRMSMNNNLIIYYLHIHILIWYYMNEWREEKKYYKHELCYPKPYKTNEIYVWWFGFFCCCLLITIIIFGNSWKIMTII